MLVAFAITVAVGLLAARVIDSEPLTSSAPTAGRGGPVPIATDMTGFDATHIIDDDVFYDSTTMTAEEITAFIDQVNSGCQTGRDGTACLAEATFDTEDREETAAGYACPDGTQCDPQYAGFFQQLYGAASQFQDYRLNPEAFQVVAGAPVQLAYSPDASCGTGEITVVNQATAGLYDYTPYQPDPAATSGGDACTSWGNWNFYGYFRALFADPTPSTLT